MIDTKMLDRYALLSKTIDGLTEERDELKDHITGAMNAEDVRLLETEQGKFILKARANYTFSETVKLAKADLKKLEEAEKKSGVAKSLTTESLSFIPKK